MHHTIYLKSSASFQEEQINLGDRLLLHIQPTANPGELAVIMDNDRASIRRIQAGESPLIVGRILQSEHRH